MAGGMCDRGHAWQILRDTVNERAVLILLECILVLYCKKLKHRKIWEKHAGNLLAPPTIRKIASKSNCFKSKDFCSGVSVGGHPSSGVRVFLQAPLHVGLLYARGL